MKIWPGQPYPLGATYDGAGTNFSLFSVVAERVELCLFDDRGNQTCVDLPEVIAYCWHGYVPEIKPGQRYAYRVHGPWAPEQGHRCHPSKLLLDPYAKAIDGQVRWDEAVFPPAAKFSRHALFVPGDSNAPRGRRNRPHAKGNNNGYCQDNEL